MMAKNSGDSTIKFLIYILLFLIFILLMLLLFIIPSIKEYKSKKSDIHRYTSQNKHLLEKQANLSEMIALYKKENNTTVKSFSADFNQSKFLDFAGKYFSNVSLVEGNVSHVQSQFQTYAFSATSQAKTPVDFYKFIDELENYPSIIKINFPITLVSKGQTIELNFNMSIYKQNN
jgi:competence protein ComGC